MDPISVLGTVGAIANIIDVLTRTVSALQHIQQEWKGANFTLVNLVAQLTALRAALTSIQEWAEAEFDKSDQFYGLTMAMDLSLTCCATLVEELDSKTRALYSNADGDLSATSKLKLLINSSKVANLQRLIDQQTNALMLLLSACHCKTSSEQKILLEQKQSQNAFCKLEKDTASLIVHRDSSSFFSRFTDTGSRLSAVFAFDSELWKSPVYERASQHVVKKLIRVRQPGSVSEADTNLFVSEAQKGGVIRRVKRKFAQEYRDDIVLVLGGSGQKAENFVRDISSAYLRYCDPHDLYPYRIVVYEALLESTKELLEVLSDFAKPTAAGTDVQAVLTPCSRNRLECPLDPKVVAMIATRWEQVHNTVSISDSTSYFLDALDRIVAPDYVPTTADILVVESKTTDSTERWIPPDSNYPNRGVRMIAFPKSYDELLDSCACTSASTSQNSLPEHATSTTTNLFSTPAYSQYTLWGLDCIVFTVDLACYDHQLSDSCYQTEMAKLLAHFSKIINHGQFRLATFIIFFEQLDTFAAKLETSPLQNYFPGYTQGNDSISAAEYIVSLFEEVCFWDMSIFSYLIQTMDKHQVDLTLKNIRLGCGERDRRILRPNV